jgi:hypothetical protein
MGRRAGTGWAGISLPARRPSLSCADYTSGTHVAISRAVHDANGMGRHPAFVGTPLPGPRSVARACVKTASGFPPES